MSLYSLLVPIFLAFPWPRLIFPTSLRKTMDKRIAVSWIRHLRKLLEESFTRLGIRHNCQMQKVNKITYQFTWRSPTVPSVLVHLCLSVPRVANGLWESHGIRQVFVPSSANETVSNIYRNPLYDGHLQSRWRTSKYRTREKSSRKARVFSLMDQPGWKKHLLPFSALAFPDLRNHADSSVTSASSPCWRSVTAAPESGCGLFSTALTRLCTGSRVFRSHPQEAITRVSS